MISFISRLFGRKKVNKLEETVKSSQDPVWKERNDEEAKLYVRDLIRKAPENLEATANPGEYYKLTYTFDVQCPKVPQDAFAWLSGLISDPHIPEEVLVPEEVFPRGSFGARERRKCPSVSVFIRMKDIGAIGNYEMIEWFNKGRDFTTIDIPTIENTRYDDPRRYKCCNDARIFVYINGRTATEDDISKLDKENEKWQWEY